MCAPVPRRYGTRSPHHAVPEMRDPGRVDHPRDLQLDGARSDPLEQPHPVAEQHGREVDLDLVDQPRLQELLDNVRPARDPDVLPARRLPRPLQGALDALGDEVEGRPALPDPGLPRAAGEDEYGGAEGRGSGQPTSPSSNMRLPIT
jgi:hypothetical protein